MTFLHHLFIKKPGDSRPSYLAALAAEARNTRAARRRRREEEADERGRSGPAGRRLGPGPPRAAAIRPGRPGPCAA
ncbi:MAG: hypothetical protein DIU60_003730 [Actinomycetes bacterium]|jgi:hypothetical protein|nr:MAG: hypothetical protein DIU60_01975 [Actinomycetota bacterium]